MGGSGRGAPHYVPEQFHNNFLSCTKNTVEMIDVTLLWLEQSPDLSRITNECAERGLNSNYFNPPHTLFTPFPLFVALSLLSAFDPVFSVQRSWFSG